MNVSAEPENHRLLTVVEAARRLHLSEGTVRRYADTGMLPVLWTPTGQRRFRVEDVDALLTARKPA
jgi:excisionase family DNA binding protein